jgi:choline dehydrogenase-like flavoprotein
MGVKPRFDAVVAGAGAGGAAAAWRLCDLGLNVLLLEAGPRFDPARDYKLHRPDWERQNFPELPGSQAGLSLGAFSRLEPAERELRSWNMVAGPLVRSGFREAQGPGYWHVQGVGGSTLRFVGESHRLHPDAMKLQSRFGAGCDWPIAYDDIERYYGLCEQLIGVAGPAEQGPRWRSTPFPLPPHPFSPAARRLQSAGSRLGMNWQANSRAALSAPYDERPPCNYCGNCSRGCPIGDKGSADVTFIRKAGKTGRLTLEANSRLVRMYPARDGRISSVEYIAGKSRHRAETPVLILAAGAVQTPRLLLANRSPRHPGGLANSSGQVGRNFMETLFWSSTGILPDLANSHAGLPSDAICWDFNGPQGIPGVIGGCRFNSNVQETGLVGPIAYASRVVSGFGSALKDGMRAKFGRCLSVGAIGEFLPNEASFVDLDPRLRDESGMPLPRIHSHLGPQDVLRLRFMASQARKLLREAGVSELVDEHGAWDLFSATHVFGTCRMGTSSGTSVVDAQGRSHDHPNLYITDASVFPSTGGGEGPSLTIQALAVRTADEIVRARRTT